MLFQDSIINNKSHYHNPVSKSNVDVLLPKFAVSSLWSAMTYVCTTTYLLNKEKAQLTI